MTQSSRVSVYQFKVTLRDSKPPIWRRIQVRGDTTLYKLHQALQVVMGWRDCHLHQFIIHGTCYGTPDPEFDFEVKNEKRVKLNRVLSGAKEKFVYEYDFGDSWEHVILLEKTLPLDQEVTYPVCLAGKCACPPEDCGGVWGYYDFLKVIQDPKHAEHAEMLEWVGGTFDPKAFDIDEVNRDMGVKS
jgi:hypothetical protein